MRKLLILALLLGGCTRVTQAPDISGLWINQAIIDAAAQGRPLKTQGANLEWDIDTRSGKAQVSSGFERGEGRLLQKSPGAWTVDYYGYGADELRFDGRHLTQLARDYAPQQVFSRPNDAGKTGEKWGATFRRALNAAYLGGAWNIVEGPGKGATVTFTANGQVSGLPGTDRYELCLDGDCASQGAGNDTVYLGTKSRGDTWIFTRSGKRMEMFQAINTSQADEVPSLTPGPRQWLLEKH